MANIYGVPTAKFKPFTFEEMLKPALMATEAHNKLEEDYSNLAIITAQLEDKLKINPKDAELRRTYEQYRDTLNNASEELYNSGLSTQSRSRFTQLKNDYATKIDPINKAYAKYQEQQAIINKLALTNPEIIVTGASDAISDYMGEKTPELASVNLDKLMSQAVAGAKADSSRTHRVSKWKTTAGGRFMERVEEIGLSDAEFEAAMNNIEQHKADKNVKLSEDAKSILKIIDTVASGSNYGLLTGADQERAYNAILTGIRAGYAYDKKIQTQSNPGYAYARAKAEAEAKAKAERQKRLAEIGSNKFITSVEGRNEFIQKYFTTDGKLKPEYKKYFNEDGTIKSKEELQKIDDENNKLNKFVVDQIPSISKGFNEYGISLQGVAKSSNITNYNNFLKDLELIGLTGDNITTGLIDAQFKSDDAQYVNRVEIIPDDTAQKITQRRIENGLINGTDVQQVKGITQNDGYKQYRTDTIKYEDLLDSKGNLNILSEANALGQLTAKVKTPNGKIVEIVIPDDAYYGSNDAEINLSYSIQLDEAQNNQRVLIEDVNDKGETIYKYEKVDPRDIIILPDGSRGNLKDLINWLTIHQDDVLKGAVRATGVIKQ